MKIGKVDIMENYCKWNLEVFPYVNINVMCDEHHVMIAGTTGSGKSVLTSDIMYILTGYHPSYQRVILFDLKRVELKRWKKFPHVMGTVTEPEEVIPMLDWIIQRMEDRYRDMEARDLLQSDHRYIHVIIDELAEVLTVKGAEQRIDKLLRLARAANIHLIMATQNPSRSSGIPARIYQNVSCKVGLRCDSAIESRQVIGRKGCEDLPRYGKAWMKNADGYFLIDIPMVSDDDIKEQLAMWTRCKRRHHA